MASPGNVLRRNWAVNTVIAQATPWDLTPCGSLREAVECLKRALISADPHEITINLKLAKLHHTLNEHGEAVAYHRRVVEVCQADR